MRRALECAGRARESADVPVGAVVLDTSGTIIAEGWNTREGDNNRAGHAEIMALQNAAKSRGTWRLEGTTLVVTLEPCVMCAGAIAQSGVSRVVYGAADEKAGAAGGGPHDLLRDRSLPHRVEEVIGGVGADDAAEMLREFFQHKRGV
mgnify:FL=1